MGFCACAVGGMIDDDSGVVDPGDGGGGGMDACASCMPGEVCSMGKCAKTCLNTELKCGTTCVDPKTDAMNCGKCGNKCPMGWGCAAGTCQLQCPMGQSPCGSVDDAGVDAGPVCIDTKTNIDNCGMCGNSCSMNMVPNGKPGCVNGTCGIGSCDMNFADCNMMAGDGCEVDITSDPKNCGKCGMACPMNLPSCSMGTCKATLCGNGQIDMGERCDGNNCNICGQTVACFPSGNKNECKWDFSKVPQLYCNGGCSWAGAQDCDQADADIYCKLVKGDPNATAKSFTKTTALAQPGFPCQPIGNYGTALGAIPEYGVNLANNGGVRYQDTSILANHGAGNVVTNVVCQ